MAADVLSAKTQKNLQNDGGASGKKQNKKQDQLSFILREHSSRSMEAKFETEENSGQ